MLLLGQGLTRPVMRLLGTPADVVDDSVLYLRIYFLCMPGTLVYMFGASYIRATGDSKRPLMLLAISGASNVVLNMLFVIVFHWGVAGVAIATAITQYLSAVLVVIYLARRRGPSALDLKKLKLHKAKLAKIIRIGLPAGLQSAILASSDMPLQFAVNSLGSLAVAGNSAALTIDGDLYFNGCLV
jgi:Na+-driven multidrug efflux pump